MKTSVDWKCLRTFLDFKGNCVAYQ